MMKAHCLWIIDVAIPSSRVRKKKKKGILLDNRRYDIVIIDKLGLLVHQIMDVDFAGLKFCIRIGCANMNLYQILTGCTLK